MASSSTSTIHKSFKYDVFLSFRGADTRMNFVDHLYYAFQQKNIHTYKDDERIKKGNKISDELMRSIEESKFYIIVFSKNYASSSWCLDELLNIMKCQKMTGHTAYPVFYDVEPCEVRKQSGAVEKAFAKHENKESAEKWRAALKEAADLAGWELKNTAGGHEAKLIQKIVEDISLQLRTISSNINKKLVGMESRIKEVVSSLETSFHDVCMMGIKGMGGGGKTTLARAVFDNIFLSFKFEGKSFVENVREVSNASLSGLKSLQKQVLSDVLNDKDIRVSNVYDGKQMMKRMMSNRKVLVVLDDVDHIDQLEAIAGETDWFKPGSVIIITTRDEQVLLAHRVRLIRDVSLLSVQEAICLFNMYAFGKEIPVQVYNGLSEQVVRYAAGLPLTIRVLGSFLCGKNELEWVDALERLKTIPLAETLKKLELSYISLEEDYKEIFLDIACILKGWRKYMAIVALESCGFHARNGLRVLEQKSLITIYGNSDNGRVDMHDHLEEMGKNIVRRLHLDKPHEHSRLWIDEEIEEILDNDLGTKATRCIRFYTEYLKPHIKGLRKMKELRFLSLVLGNGFYNLKNDNIAIPDFPNDLRYLRVKYYPYRSLPATYQADNLVALEMIDSKIEQLWEWGENKVFKKLRFLDLSGSTLNTLDLWLTPNLEKLTLFRCYNLVELHIHVECLKLISIDLKYLWLRTLDLVMAPNLETLILAECCNLVGLRMPRRSLYLRYLQLTNSKLRTLDIGLTPNLEYLDLQNSFCLEELHMPDESDKLTYLDIGHSKLRTLHIGLTPNLKYLDLQNSYYLEELHMADESHKLAYLDISHSKLRTIDLGLTPNLETLHLKECCNLVEIRIPTRCLNNLAHIDLSGCLGFRSFLFNSKGFTSFSVDESLEVGPLAKVHLIVEFLASCPLHPGNSSPKFQLRCLCEEDRPSLTRYLETLFYQGMCTCTNLETSSRSICGLQRLKKLKLEGSILQVLKDLDHLECLEELILSCTMIKHLPDNILMSKRLKSLDLNLCVLLEKLPKDLGRLECLEKLDLSYTNIKHLPDSICMLKHLKSLKLKSCIFLEKLPGDLGGLECLENLNLSSTKIRCLPDSICVLKHLKSLELDHCSLLEKLPEDFGRLQCLKDLNFFSTMIRRLPDSICMLKHLKSLELDHCSLLEKLPEDLGRLECLEKLSLKKCESLQDIPNSIGKMECIKYFHLPDCIRVMNLPEEIGSLKSLKELNIEGTSISHLPHSIFLLKDLHIFGSRGLVQSSRFTSEIKKTPECETSFLLLHSNGMNLRISEKPGKPIHKRLSQQDQ